MPLSKEIQSRAQELSIQKQPIEPVYFRLPGPGGDQHFGLSRSWYYQAEGKGLIKFKRLREPNKERGIVLIDYRSVRDFLSKPEVEPASTMGASAEGSKQ